MELKVDFSLYGFVRKYALAAKLAECKQDVCYFLILEFKAYAWADG